LVEEEHVDSENKLVMDQEEQGMIARVFHAPNIGAVR